MYWSIFADIKVVTGVRDWVVFTTGLLGIAFSAVMAIAMTTHKAIYDSDAVEIRCAIPFPWWTGRMRTNRMLRSDIAAKKNISIIMPTYVLYPKERNKWSLAIWGPKEDDYFRNWIAGIPDADRQFFRNRRKSNRQP